MKHPSRFGCWGLDMSRIGQKRDKRGEILEVKNILDRGALHS